MNLIVEEKVKGKEIDKEDGYLKQPNNSNQLDAKQGNISPLTREELTTDNGK